MAVFWPLQRLARSLTVGERDDERLPAAELCAAREEGEERPGREGPGRGEGNPGHPRGEEETSKYGERCLNLVSLSETAMSYWTQ